MAPSRADVPAHEQRRRYRSPLRSQQAEQTRAAILDSATVLFSARGWTGTNMRDVAEGAGVTVETIYAHFRSKPGLLRAVNDAAVVGDTAPEPLADRREFQAIGEGAPVDRCTAAARVATAVHRRTAALQRVLGESAATDDAMADALGDARTRIRGDVATGLRLLTGRDPDQVERDGAFALLSAEVYLLLTETCGWTSQHYEHWLAGMLETVFVDPNKEDRT